MKNAKNETQRLAKDYEDRGNPNGWFEEFYARAGGDIKKIYWADLKEHPLLLDWLKKQPAPVEKRAIIVGCGLGDDAELLRKSGFQVVAFDISASAIEMCRQRYPDSQVDYRVADLFNPPADWHRGFDLIFECNTIQILKGRSRIQAIKAIADLVAPCGTLLVSCRSRNKGEASDAFPLPLDRDEINGFQQEGLTEVDFLAYDDDQDPPVPHFFGVYSRPA